MSSTPEKHKVTLTDGREITLTPLSVWDATRFRARFGKNFEAIHPPSGELPPEGTPERFEHEAFQQEAMLFIAYRCAVNAGYDGTEEEFWSSVPLVGDDLGKLLEASSGFFGGARGSESSPGSSGQDSASEN
jgi:hypothetical protein